MTAPWRALWTLALCFVTAGAGAELTPAEERGKRIYTQGSGSSGEEIVAVLRNQTIELPATALPCVTCHKADGSGSPEGGLVPSNLTWPSLTRPYEVERPGGRRHPPYDERLLIRAITMGIDPAGNELHVAMPRYRLSRADADDLVAYIKRLGRGWDPGVGYDVVRVGTLLPLSGPRAALGRRVRILLEQFFERVNGRGGIYRRRIELVVADAPDGAAERVAAFTRLLEETPVLALVAPFSGGADPELRRAAEARGVPLVGPITQTPAVEGWPGGGPIFYLLSGLDEQARALAEFLAARNPEARSAVVSIGPLPSDSIVSALTDQLRRRRLAPPEVATLPATADARAVVADLRRRQIDSVFLLAPGEPAVHFVRAAGDSGWRPDFLLLGPLAGHLVLDGAPDPPGSVFLSYPTLPDDLADVKGLLLRRLVEAGDGGSDASALSQRLALAAAELLLEALSLTGRDLTRSGLVGSLESFFAFQTGLTPPLTFGPNRRIGSLGAYVVELDPRVGAPIDAGVWTPIRE